IHSKSSRALPLILPQYIYLTCAVSSLKNKLPQWHGVGLSAYTPRIFFRCATVVLWGNAAIPSARGRTKNQEPRQFSMVNCPSSKRFTFVPGAKGISFHKNIFGPLLGMGTTIPNPQ